MLIDRLDLGLSPGLNIITGETGAGKSILLGALGLLLGSRAEANAIMDPSRNCVVEGVFDVGGYGLEEFFNASDLDYAPCTTIRRVIAPGGKSRAYINDLPVQLATLRELGVRLIDIHSQHQSLMLASDAFRCGILDSVAGNRGLLGRYGAAYVALQEASRELAALRGKAAQDAQEQDYVSFQYGQLREANLRAGEQEELEAQHAELSHAGQIREALALSANLLDEDEAGVLSRLKTAAQSIARTSDYYPRAGELHGRLHSSLEELKDIVRELSAEADRVDSDPGRLQLAADRLDLLYMLQKKHGVQSVEALIVLRDEYAVRLNNITSAAEHIAALEKRVRECHDAAAVLADELTLSRRTAAAEVKRHVEELLGGLGMPGAYLNVEVEPCGELHATGNDATRFLFTANRNTVPQPVEKVASGGETSRLMLALKSLVAERSMLPTVIFDEIDAGVSGRVADAMGDIICAMAGTMQVVNITHLPQVASKGQTHFVVYKEDTPSGTRSHIRLLDREERVAEIAKMLSGSRVTDAATAQARSLLGE